MQTASALKRFLPILFLAILSIGFWAYSAPTTMPTTTQATDLALNKPATASSQEEGNIPSHAVDGNPDTRWCAVGGDVGEWWKVDLQKAEHLTRIVIKWEMDEKNYQYIVEGSADDGVWKTLSDQTKTKSTSQIQTLEFDAENIRYVRIRVTGLEENVWASFYDVKIFGL